MKCQKIEDLPVRGHHDYDYDGIKLVIKFRWTLSYLVRTKEKCVWEVMCVYTE